MKRQVGVLYFMAAMAVVAATQGAAPTVAFKDGKYKIDVLVGGKRLASYRHTPDPSQPLAAKGILQTKPVLYPIYTASGIDVTRAYPSADVPGEKQDHPHHQGLWFAVDNVGPAKDKFWGNSKSPLPAVRHVKVLREKGGVGTGTLETLSHWVGSDGTALLEEDREMVFRPEANQTAIDFSIYLTALGQEIDFEDTTEGMFALRVAQWLTEEGTGRYLNSDGEETEAGVWGKRSNWVRLQGAKDGKSVGIVILNHPKSTNSPTYWHARAYGCFSVNPLGQLDFQTTLKVPNPKPFNLKLKSGERALFKYRVIVYEGNLDKPKVDALYQSYIR